MNTVVMLAIAVVVILALYAVGRGLRTRSRQLKIGVIATVMLILFLGVSLAVNRFGISVYEYYQFETCPNSVAKCVPTSQQDFDATIPRLTLLMTVPTPLRPACETVSQEFCTLETTWDFGTISYIVGAFGVLIAVFIVLLGLRQKRNIEAPLMT